MSWDCNVYSSPSKFGLTPVAEIDYSSGSYEFDLRVVWRKEDGTLVTARDSGCSCPVPFESVGIDGLEPVNMDVLESEKPSEYSGPSLAEQMTFLRKVQELLLESKK